MGNTAWHVATYLNQAIASSDPSDYKRLVMFSGHDTTIMPFLAALLGDGWDGQWAAYAALVTIELYDTVVAGGFLFRLIYNGKVLTVPGCSPAGTLCNVNVLLEALSFGQEFMPCSVTPSSGPSPPSPSPANPAASGTSDSGALSTSEWGGLCALSAFLGALIGVGCLVFWQRKQRYEVDDIEVNLLAKSSHVSPSNAIASRVN